MRRAVMLVAVLGLGACTFAIIGEDRFRAEALRREATFVVNYQALFRCFAATVPQGNTEFMGMGSTPATAHLYPDLGFGEYRWATPHGANSAFFSLVEFRSMTEAKTRVLALNASESDLEDHWRKITACVQ